MIRCFPASGDTNREHRGWTLSRRSGLRMAVLVFFAGAFLAAVTVAAAREPDPQAAYGPPPPPAAVIAPSADEAGTDATISGTALSPAVVSSSWVMGPLPEHGGVAISATVMSPVTTTSMVAAAPR